ncbi:calcium-binding protein [Campylobacter sp. RM16192]|uniref:calcium-binding protein n=1 Tax=Campylobacter sp. RM16192 TaxID=1660080 RepID=UPI001554C130|nr:calcium-binding protein [Campylobacter sp. RM16192]
MISIYNKGDGVDVIEDSSGKDSLELKGIDKDEVKFMKENSSLKVFMDDKNHITITGWFNEQNQIESIKFDDQTELKPGDIINSLVSNGDDTIVGTNEEDTLDGKEGNDTITGLNKNDTFIGGSGNDKLYGNSGNDTLIGGTGSDYLEGGGDNDTYIYNKGDGSDKINDTSGNDKIKFSDILKDDISFRKNKLNLIITIKPTNDTIEVLNFFTVNNAIEELEFSDGSKMTNSDIGSLFSYTSGDTDTIYAKSNATLKGEKGNDVYSYKRGNGKVIIDDSFIENNIEINAGEDTFCPTS